MIWKVKIPDDGWIKASLGMKPESWDKEGDGVLFRIGVSDGRAFEDLLTLHVDPFHNKSDRRWIPVAVDVSPYAGEEVEVIFNTNNSMPGKGDDRDNDTALFADAGNRGSMTSAIRTPVRLLDLEAQYRPLRG